MPSQSADQLTAFLDDKIGAQLRSVVAYDASGYEIVFLREDLQDVYAEEDVDQIMQGLRLEALERPLIADVFAADHGELTCQVKCFEHVVEVNVTLSETEGVAIAMDGDVFQEGRSLLGEIRRIAQSEYATQ